MTAKLSSIRGIFLIAALSTWSSLAQAQESEETLPAPSEPNFLTEHTIGKAFADETGISLRGWLDAGFTANGEGGGTNYNGPVSFNDRRNEAEMNQLYFVLERSIDKTSSSFQIGGRADLLYGTDAQFTQALGWDNDWGENRKFYKLAMPQLYVETFVPVGSGLSFKIGHFYTLIGNETVTAPDNFFYSHAYVMQYGEPFTHLGALASYALTDSLSVTAGVTRGWDNVSESDKDAQFIGSLSWSGEGTSVVFALSTGNEASSLNRTIYSLVVNHQLTEKLKYTVQHDWAYQEDGSSTGGAAHWYGINQYLTYAAREDLSYGVRAEWFDDPDGVRVAGVRSGTTASPSDYVEITAGVNYLPTPNIKIRPEIRYDVQFRDDGSSPGAYGNGTSINQWTSAVDVILSF